MGNVGLYSLANDIGEHHNLAHTEPKRTAVMMKLLDDWLKQVDASMPTPNPHYDPHKCNGRC